MAASEAVGLDTASTGGLPATTGSDTVIVPCISGWIWQKNGKLPAVSKVCVNVAPGARMPLSNAPSDAVAVWLSLSVFVHSTVPPVAISTVGGMNTRSPIVTAPDVGSSPVALVSPGFACDDDRPEVRRVLVVPMVEVRVRARKGEREREALSRLEVVGVEALGALARTDPVAIRIVVPPGDGGPRGDLEARRLERGGDDDGVALGKRRGDRDDERQGHTEERGREAAPRTPDGVRHR